MTVSDCTTHPLGYLRYVTKTCACEVSMFTNEFDYFFVDSLLSQIEPLCKHSLPFSTDVRVSTDVRFTALKYFRTNPHGRSVIEHTAVHRRLRQITVKFCRKIKLSMSNTTSKLQ